PAAPAPGAPAAPQQPAARRLTGKTVFLDPGHQASAAGHDLNKPVPDGRGGMKPCQTTGATGVNGVGEHTVNWQVAQLVKGALESQGARVVLSRPDDIGWGGCINERTAAANRSRANLAVSIHADSSGQGANAGKSGFHVIVPKLPLPDKQADSVQRGAGRKASATMRDAFKKAGFHPSNYLATADGLQERSDIAGPNTSHVPLAFVEMGNLSNPAEAQALSAHDGQLKYAAAITDGAMNFLTGSSAGTGLFAGGPENGPAPEGAGLGGLLPAIQDMMRSGNLAGITGFMTGPASDAGSEVLKAMLAVVYGLFGGKLPI
ncbi:N-acetylmuramoyl-L-alanine amidase family protein, partial [Gordonia sp. (in: high G+C Gram-positive bacteria)]|uniref:N-acetylmuramoyl-L-alanine amidase family protein n=1 Tax=Gordonia sp. (in: high G+C Gram-positive bacteria) TaxID=84139 RepID=UPI0039E49929